MRLISDVNRMVDRCVVVNDTLRTSMTPDQIAATFPDQVVDVMIEQWKHAHPPKE